METGGTSDQPSPAHSSSTRVVKLRGDEQWNSPRATAVSTSPERRHKRRAISPLPSTRTSQAARTSPHAAGMCEHKSNASFSPKFLGLPPRSAHPAITGSLSVSRYQQLNRIQEGSYGVVYRARHRQTQELVALKKIKLDQNDGNGFPITSIREIRALTESLHPNIVQLREVAVGDRLSQVYLVMEFVEHDLYTLLRRMRTPFLASEIKTMLHQLLSALAAVHYNWLIHRDLKTSNILLSNNGQIKLADFGLARQFSDPPPSNGMTLNVVSLWYRPPELLLGAREYNTSIDMWSAGCVMAELLLREPLFPGTNSTDQVSRIFHLLGAPSPSTWPGFARLAHAARIAPLPTAQSNRLRARFRPQNLSHKGLDLLQGLLTYDPAHRLTAEDALRHPWFHEAPLPAHPDTFGSFPSAAAGDGYVRKSCALHPTCLSFVLTVTCTDTSLLPSDHILCTPRRPCSPL